MTDLELLDLLARGESDRVERKRAWTGDVPDKVRQAICAFANDLPAHGLPGVVFIGVADDGSFVDTPIDDDLLTKIAHIKLEGKIIPPPSMTVEKRVLDGHEVAVVTVQPADAPPVRYDGRVCVRVGPRKGVATAQDERLLAEKRRHKDKAFDSRPIFDASVSDLNQAQFEGEFLPQAFADDVLAANGRSYVQRLSSLGLVASVDDPVPTLTGILVLGKSPLTFVPGAYVQFLRIAGTGWGGVILDEQVIDGSMDQLLRQLDAKLKAHLTVGVSFGSGQAVEERMPSYPFSALQQIVRNAVMHRNYEGTNAPVRVYWFDDRIEVHSPGGPFGAVTVDNFGVEGITDYRNPSLAAALRTMGFVQKFGFGIAMAKRALLENGHPPLEFEVNEGAVLVTLRARQ